MMGVLVGCLGVEDETVEWRWWLGEWVAIEVKLRRRKWKGREGEEWRES